MTAWHQNSHAGQLGVGRCAILVVPPCKKAAAACLTDCAHTRLGALPTCTTSHTFTDSSMMHIPRHQASATYGQTCVCTLHCRLHPTLESNCTLATPRLGAHHGVDGMRQPRVYSQPASHEGCLDGIPASFKKQSYWPIRMTGCPHDTTVRQTKNRPCHNADTAGDLLPRFSRWPTMSCIESQPIS